MSPAYPLLLGVNLNSVPKYDQSYSYRLHVHLLTKLPLTAYKSTSLLKIRLKMILGHETLEVGW